MYPAKAVIYAKRLLRNRPRLPVARLEVTGPSMLPALHPGDRVVVVRTRRVHPGDVVACVDPNSPDRTMVKRVAADGPSGYVVVGDNPSVSTDSRHFGPIHKNDIIGRLFYRYAPEGRRGPIGRVPPAACS